MSVPATPNAASSTKFQFEPAAFLTSFDTLGLPLQQGKVIYPRNAVLLLSLPMTLTGAKTFVNIALFWDNQGDLRENMKQLAPQRKA